MSKNNEKTTSHTQHDSAQAGSTIPGFEVFGDLAAQSAARLQGFFDQLSKLDETGTERTRVAGAELGKLWTDSMSYGIELAAEWRRAGLAMARRTTEMVRARA